MQLCACVCVEYGLSRQDFALCKNFSELINFLIHQQRYTIVVTVARALCIILWQCYMIVVLHHRLYLHKDTAVKKCYQIFRELYSLVIPDLCRLHVDQCAWVYIYIYIYLCMCVCVCVLGEGGIVVCVCVCVCVCSCDVLQRNVFPPFKSCCFCFLLLLFLEEFFTRHLVQTNLIVVGWIPVIQASGLLVCHYLHNFAL